MLIFLSILVNFICSWAKTAQVKQLLQTFLAGVYPFRSYSGTVTFRGQELRLSSPRDAIKRKIITIHQDTCLYENMTIADNLFANPASRDSINGNLYPSEKESSRQRFFQKHNVSIDASRADQSVQRCYQAESRTFKTLSPESGSADSG